MRQGIEQTLIRMFFWGQLVSHIFGYFFCKTKLISFACLYWKEFGAVIKMP